MKTSHTFIVLVLVAGLALVVGPTPLAHAAEISVPCDLNALIAAITMANANGGADTLNLAAGCTYTLTEGYNGSNYGLPVLSSEIVINGNGATIERSNAPDTPYFNVLGTSGAVTLKQLTVRHGEYVYWGIGGGIANEGTLTLIDSTVSGNSGSHRGGGGIGNGGTLTLINSTVSANWPNGIEGGTVTLTNSTVSGNGTGIHMSDQATLINSTVSGNGTGIYIHYGCWATLINSTVSGNERGIHIWTKFGEEGYAYLRNSIVADNPSGNCGSWWPPWAGQQTGGAGGYNVEWVETWGHNLDSDGSCVADGVNGDISVADPLLGPLQDNGGPTETYALLPSSPAIDAGDDVGCPATDQRGAPRPQDGDGDGAATCDIGAYELQPLPVPLDIQPQSCPNPINVKKKGVLPAAILGAGDFDLAQVDPASVRLEGVAPLRWALEDVATPYEPFIGKEDAYDCTEGGPDGHLDLTLKFDAQEVVAALGEIDDGDVLVLQLTGNLKEDSGGTPIVGEDVVWILKKGEK